jgi:hypothetical protein
MCCNLSNGLIFTFNVLYGKLWGDIYFYSGVGHVKGLSSLLMWCKLSYGVTLILMWFKLIYGATFTFVLLYRTLWDDPNF